jgi:hypothetical protein
MRSVLVVAAITSGALMLTGCATQPVADHSASVITDPTQSTYTRDDLNNTGRHDTAAAIRAIDPAVR